MITEIEEAIIARLEDKGLNVAKRRVKDGSKHVKLPAVYVTTQAGDFMKETLTKYRCEISVSVAVVFKNLKSDQDQRHGVYPILMSVTSFLMLQDLGLEIRPLKPIRFRNITDEEMAEGGLTAFQLVFKTSFILTRMDEEEAFDLLRIGLSYFLQDPEDDNVVDAQDIVTLEED